MKRRKYMRRQRNEETEDEDPLSGVANLFDVAMVFAVGMLLMVLIYFSMPDILTQQDMTIVKITDQSVEIIEKHGEKIETLEMSNETVETEIEGKFGTIYKTKDGEFLFTPVDMAGG